MYSTAEGILKLLVSPCATPCATQVAMWGGERERPRGGKSVALQKMGSCFSGSKLPYGSWQKETDIESQDGVDPGSKSFLGHEAPYMTLGQSHILSLT